MHEAPVTNWEALGEVERVLWNHYDQNYCIVRFIRMSEINFRYISNNCIPLQISTDNGYIEYFDVRERKPLWQIKAHEKEVTGK